MEINTSVSQAASPVAQSPSSAASATVASNVPVKSQSAGAVAASTAQSPDMAQALQHFQAQVGTNSSITLRAGLDTTGNHPGQVLVELMDKATKQVFYHYYMPAEKVLQAATNSEGLAPGSLLKGKA